MLLSTLCAFAKPRPRQEYPCTVGFAAYLEKTSSVRHRDTPAAREIKGGKFGTCVDDGKQPFACCKVNTD